jgi:hypothetical protein
MIIEDKKGNQLLELQRGREGVLSVPEPPMHALIVVRNSEKRFLLVYDRWWDRRTPIGDIAEIDAKLVELASETDGPLG